MLYIRRLTAGFVTSLCLSGFAFAAPPVTDNTEVLMEKIEEKLSDHSGDLARSTARLKRKMDNIQKSTEGDIGEDLEGLADVMEEVFAEDDVDTDDGKTVLKFDGTEVAQIQHKSSRDSEDKISISGLGKSFSLDRKTVVQNGKSKTRIVIDMNGEDEIDLTVPTP